MSDIKQRITDFISHLHQFGGSTNRGALADLRSGLGQKPGQATRMHKYVVPYLADNINPSDRHFYTVAALFGNHPENSSKTLGQCFRSLKSKSDSTEARFRALLSCHSDDLHQHLVYAVGLIKSARLGLNYHRLLSDIIYWDHQEQFTQNKWAREFYRNEAIETKETTND